MIRVDTLRLKRNINILNSLIDEYEDIQLNLFNQLKNCSIDWQDGNSICFDNSIYLDKKESELILIELKEKINLFSYIYDEYSVIGNNINVNLNNKEKLLYSIESDYIRTKNIISEFDNIGNFFYCPEKENINFQYKKMISIKNKLSNYKNLVSKMFKKVEVIERNIKIKLKKIEEIRINEFEFSLRSKNSSSVGILNEENMFSNIEKINYYKEEEYKKIKSICLTLRECCDNYCSDNTKLILMDLDVFEKSIDALLLKREEYVKILKNTIQRYQKLSNFIINRFGEQYYEL